MGYEEAVNAAHKHGHDGVGFVLSPQAPWSVVDLDGVINSETGEVAPWAVALVDGADSYTELSPSGTGLHIIVKAKLGFKKKGKPPVEIFSQGGYVTVTGKVFHDAPIQDAQGWLEDLHREHHAPKPVPGTTNVYPLRRIAMTADEVLRKARSCPKTGPRFSELYDYGSSVPVGARSEADMFLVSRLAFWSGGDAEQVKRLFRLSDMARGHYADAGLHGESYLSRTVDKAISERQSFYDPTEGERAKERVRQIVRDHRGRLEGSDLRGSRRRVMEEMLRIAEEVGHYRSGGVDFNHNQYVIAAAVSVSQEMVSKSIKSLVGRGWIVRTS